ncbi:hypothetical protein GCM10009802_19710 [Streptomyces synnematoformans]|uniref:Uncharacterized protein n=1 Tax=Streptomyces synnematoformans TaxID=415721 RepID=A0ABN2XWD4_9ACTN
MSIGAMGAPLDHPMIAFGIRTNTESEGVCAKAPPRHPRAPDCAAAGIRGPRCPPSVRRSRFTRTGHLRRKPYGRPRIDSELRRHAPSTGRPRRGVDVHRAGFPAFLEPAASPAPIRPDGVPGTAPGGPMPCIPTAAAVAAAPAEPG